MIHILSVGNGVWSSRSEGVSWREVYPLPLGMEGGSRKGLVNSEVSLVTGLVSWMWAVFYAVRGPCAISCNLCQWCELSRVQPGLSHIQGSLMDRWRTCFVLLSWGGPKGQRESSGCWGTVNQKHQETVLPEPCWTFGIYQLNSCGDFHLRKSWSKIWEEYVLLFFHLIAHCLFFFKGTVFGIGSSVLSSWKLIDLKYFFKW